MAGARRGCFWGGRARLTLGILWSETSPRNVQKGADSLSRDSVSIIISCINAVVRSKIRPGRHLLAGV